jgi:hypothetical protein
VEKDQDLGAESHQSDTKGDEWVKYSIIWWIKHIDMKYQDEWEF